MTSSTLSSTFLVSPPALFLPLTLLSVCLSGRDALPSWDRQIESVCQQVNQVVEQISALHPQWVAETLETQMS